MKKKNVERHNETLSKLSENYYYVVLDNKTRRETGYETLEEAESTMVRLGIETGTVYRYTVQHRKGAF